MQDPPDSGISKRVGAFAGEGFGDGGVHAEAHAGVLLRGGFCDLWAASASATKPLGVHRPKFLHRAEFYAACRTLFPYEGEL